MISRHKFIITIPSKVLHFEKKQIKTQMTKPLMKKSVIPFGICSKSNYFVNNLLVAFLTTPNLYKNIRWKIKKRVIDFKTGMKYLSCCSPDFFFHVAVISMIVLFAGMMSGLTLGLMSMSLVDLEVLAKSGKPMDRLRACSHLIFIFLFLFSQINLSFIKLLEI